MIHAAYHLLRPAVPAGCVIFASPHSGREYEPSFLDQSKLDASDIRSSEDAFVDDLIRAAPDHGATLLLARVPRAYVDFNRAAEELDPALIEGIRRMPPNPRVASGLGVIPRVVAGGRAIYDGKLPLAQAHARLTACWHPWHDQLQTLLDEAHRGFGRAILIDCHSMPHEALDNVVGSGGLRPDVVIGDRFGSSASGHIVAAVERILTHAGLRVVRNMPFAGAYVTQHYGRPQHHQHAIQIEVDRSLYMDESSLEKRPDFDDFQRLMTGVVAQIAALGAAGDAALAAE